MAYLILKAFDNDPANVYTTRVVLPAEHFEKITPSRSKQTKSIVKLSDMPLDAEVSVPFDKVLWLDDSADDAFPQSDRLCCAEENEERALTSETVAEAVARLTIDTTTH